MSAERVCKSYEVWVGLEIHVQLSTATKLFTAAANGATNFGAPPNSLADPVVLGMPGVLPVMNRAAVESSIKVGLALGCEIARHTKWDRKSYYYPDLPKNYQVSQYDEPLCGPGVFHLESADGSPPVPIRIRRAHLEEDAGKLLHEAPGGFAIDHSIVDLNRAGTPLLEIVTEPDFRTAEQVSRFAQALQKLVQFLGVSEGQMQRGHMRFEPNINVLITDAAGVVHKTAITEVKNLNSFVAVEKATDYEVRRQIDAWVQTGSLGKKSTYGWNDAINATYWQRDKEDADDYRYFPDPDLMPVVVDDAWLADLKRQVGELPAQRLERYVKALGLSAKEAATLTADRATGDWFEEIMSHGVSPKRAGIMIEVLRNAFDEPASEDGDDESDVAVAPPAVTTPIAASAIADLAKLVEAGKVAGNKDTLQTVFRHVAASTAAGEPTTAEAAATALGLVQSTDAGPIDALIDALIAENPKPLQDYRGGKQAARGSLIGMLMKRGKGLNAKLVGERLDAKVLG